MRPAWQVEGRKVAESLGPREAWSGYCRSSGRAAESSARGAAANSSTTLRFNARGQAGWLPLGTRGRKQARVRFGDHQLAGARSGASGAESLARRPSIKQASAHPGSPDNDQLSSSQ